jgi:hypothetical protein
LDLAFLSWSQKDGWTRGYATLRVALVYALNFLIIFMFNFRSTSSLCRTLVKWNIYCKFRNFLMNFYAPIARGNNHKNLALHFAAERRLKNRRICPGFRWSKQGHYSRTKKNVKFRNWTWHSFHGLRKMDVQIWVKLNAFPPPSNGGCLNLVHT